MTKLGMNADAVSSLASQLDGEAAKLQTVIGTVEQLVSRVGNEWRGPDAMQFADWWHSKHRVILQRAHDSIAGLAQSARNNVVEQARVSGASAWLGGAAAGGAAARAARGGNGWVFGDDLTWSSENGWNAAIGWSDDHDVGVGPRPMWDKSGHTSLGLLPVSGTVSAEAHARATAYEHFGVGLDGLDASVGASAGLGAGLAASGMIGNRIVSASAAGNLDARASVEGNASAHLGMDGAKAGAHLGAEAGASAGASASANIWGVGGTAGAHVTAGIGAHADVDAELTMHEVKASIDVGAALGVGGGFKVKVDIKPSEVIHNISKWHW